MLADILVSPKLTIMLRLVNDTTKAAYRSMISTMRQPHSGAGPKCCICGRSENDGYRAAKKIPDHCHIRRARTYLCRKGYATSVASIAGPELVNAAAISRGKNESPLPASALDAANSANNSSKRIACVKKNLLGQSWQQVSDGFVQCANTT
jgi:hypothetical protein